MTRLHVKILSKVHIVFLWNYDTANLAIFRDKQMLGHSVSQTPALFALFSSSATSSQASSHLDFAHSHILFGFVFGILPT